MAQRVPLATTQGGGEARELEEQRAVVGQRLGAGPQTGGLVAVVHQPVDVDHHARPRHRRRTEAARQQRITPRAAVRARELDELPGGEQTGADELLDGLVSLPDRGAGLDRARLVGNRGVVEQLGQTAVCAPPHRQRVARVRSRVRGEREVVRGRLVAQVQDDLAARSTGSPGSGGRQPWTSAAGEVAPRARGPVPRAEGVHRQRPGDGEIRVVVAHGQVLGRVVWPVDAVADVGDLAQHLEAVQEAARGRRASRTARRPGGRPGAGRTSASPAVRPRSRRGSRRGRSGPAWPRPSPPRPCSPRSVPYAERDCESWTNVAGSRPCAAATSASKVRVKNPRSSRWGDGRNSSTSRSSVVSTRMSVKPPPAPWTRRRPRRTGGGTPSRADASARGRPRRPTSRGRAGSGSAG